MCLCPEGQSLHCREVECQGKHLPLKLFQEMQQHLPNLFMELNLPRLPSER